jgi:aryl-alcohol dehydrogenase-like predicted oxidoreductase
MTVIDRIQIEETNIKRPYQEKISMLDCKETGELRGFGFETQTLHRMRLVVGVEFWANQAQYNLAREQAQRHLLHTLHGDMLAKIDGAIHAIYNNDQENSLNHLFAIRKELIG